jgi:hypothetical protein
MDLLKVFSILSRTFGNKILGKVFSNAKNNMVRLIITGEVVA